MAPSTKDPILAIAGQAGGVAGPVKSEVKVGIGLVAAWYAVSHLCECGLHRHEGPHCVAAQLTSLTSFDLLHLIFSWFR